MTRSLCTLLLFPGLIILAGCGKPQSICPTGAETQQFIAVPLEALPTSTSGLAPTPVEMTIGGKTITVDKVIEGLLCNDTWSGIVYVSCDIQVYPWEDSPTFLQNCNLKIEPGTVVYVAHHNDAAYYNGCSCHTGLTAEP